MASVTPQIADGTTIAFASWAELATMQVRSISHTGIKREVKDASHLGTVAGAKPFLAERTYDPGELSVGMWFDSDGNVTNFNTAMSAVTAGAITITFPDLETAIFSGFLTGFEWTGEQGEIMTATATFKIAALTNW